MALKYIADRLNDYNINLFVSELADAAKYLGILQAKIDTYQFNSILIRLKMWLWEFLQQVMLLTSWAQ